jgi:hypothetical protein
MLKIELQNSNASFLQPRIFKENIKYSYIFFSTEKIVYSHNLLTKEKVVYNHNLLTKEKVVYSHNLVFAERKYLLQIIHITLLQQGMLNPEIIKTTIAISNWRWVKFNQSKPLTLANSTVVSQSTQTSVTYQNYTHAKSMLQRPTEKIATLNKSKNNIEQTILQWPTNKITTPYKSKSKTEQPVIQWPSKNIATHKEKIKKTTKSPKLHRADRQTDNSTLGSQSTQTSVTYQNYTHAKSMLQRPTNKIDTQNKFKKNTEQPILQWPTNRITTPNKSKSKTEQPIIQWPSKNLATPPKPETIKI